MLLCVCVCVCLIYISTSSNKGSSPFDAQPHQLEAPRGRLFGRPDGELSDTIGVPRFSSSQRGLQWAQLVATFWCSESTKNATLYVPLTMTTAYCEQYFRHAVAGILRFKKWPRTIMPIQCVLFVLVELCTLIITNTNIR